MSLPHAYPLLFASTSVDWVAVALNLGVPTVILLAIGWGTWKGLAWVGREIVIPLRDRLLTRLGGFFDRVDTALESMTEHMRQQTEAMKELKETTDESVAAWLAVRDAVKCRFEPKQNSGGCSGE